MEEVALFTRAKLVSDQVALYMFGYYALRADRSNGFWSPKFPKRPDYWLLYTAFVKEMEAVEARKKSADFVKRVHI